MRRALLLLACLAWPALAQELPDRPIRIFVPLPPSGSTNLLARVLAEAATPFTPCGCVIENRSGAGGGIGMVEAARAHGWPNQNDR